MSAATRYAQALGEARARLAASSSSAALDSELLLAKACDVSRTTLIAHPEREMSDSQLTTYSRLVEQRADGVPMAYLTGEREFWSLSLRVTPAVLVPRPETELVVELALDWLEGRAAPAVLDLGTGSGAIALAIARERADAGIIATDESAAALEVARGNACTHRLGNVEFRQGHWYEPVAGTRFDLIASNPPYLADDDPHWPGLRHEPRPALLAGSDGLEDLRQIVDGAALHLLPGGLLIVEHGASQGAAVRALLGSAGLHSVATHCDLAGLDRVTTGLHQG